MGAISSVCYSKLGICAYAFASRKSSSASLGSRQGAQTYSHLWDVDVNSGNFAKRASFFALRIVFAIISSVCEAKLYRAVMEHVYYRVGRYLFFILLFSAGMWNSATGAVVLYPRCDGQLKTFLQLSFLQHLPCSRRRLPSRTRYDRHPRPTGTEPCLPRFFSQRVPSSVGRSPSPSPFRSSLRNF